MKKYFTSQQVRNIFSLLAIVVAAIAILFAVAGCGNNTPSIPFTNTKIPVAVSVNQWTSVAEAIGGSDVSVTTIMSNAATDPHDFEPDPQAIASISKAKIVFINGAGYDDWASKAAHTGSGIIVNAARSGGISLGQNPHVWFSKDVRQAAATEFLDALKKVEPKRASTFQKNYDQWEKREARLNSNISKAADELKDKTYVSTESLPYYLAKDLGLKDITPPKYTQAISNGSEPAPADLHALQKIIQNKEAGVLFDNTQAKSPTNKMLVEAANKAGVPVIKITETRPSEYKTLIEWVQALVTQIQQAYGVQS